MFVFKQKTLHIFLTLPLLQSILMFHQLFCSSSFFKKSQKKQKNVLFWSTFPFFFKKKNKNCFSPPLSWGKTSLFEKMCSILFFFCISLASFLNTSLVYPFFHPFFCLSLLDSLSWFVSSFWMFLSSFFFVSFFSIFPLFSLFSLSFSFFWGRGAHFSFSVFPCFWLWWFSEFFSTFASPVCLSFPLFLNKKKNLRFEKSTFLSLKKMVFENVLKFDLCHTSPFVFNSCITYFHFFHDWENILFVFELCFWRTSFFFLFLRCFSFLLLFIIDFSFLYLVNLPFCSLRYSKKKTSSCFSLLYLSSFHHFFGILLSNLRSAWFFHGLPFLSAWKKNFHLSFFSPLPQFFSFSLFSNCLFFVSSFRLHLCFISLSVFASFHFFFISLLSISCFLISFFLLPIFLYLVLSFTSFVTDLICLYFLLVSKKYFSVLLSIFMSFLSCRFRFIFCVNPSLFLTSCFSAFVLSFFSPPFIFFFLTVFLHLSFMSLLGLFLFVFFFYFSFLCISMFFPSCVHFSFFLKNVFVSCMFRFCHFPSVFDLFQQNIPFLLPHSHCFQHFQKQIPFSPDIWSHFWYSLLIKKSPCSNFHFDRPHSETYVSRFFFHLLTLFFMFPLLCMYVPSRCSLSLCPPSSLLLSLFCRRTASRASPNASELHHVRTGHLPYRNSTPSMYGQDLQPPWFCTPHPSLSLPSQSHSPSTLGRMWQRHSPLLRWFPQDFLKNQTQ